MLVQQDLISISEPLLYDGKQLHPQFIVSNENAKYQYLPIANTNCGAIDSTMLFIKPYDVTQSVLRSEKSLV